MRKLVAEQFIRFIWQPRVGDRVVARKVKTTVDSISAGEVYVKAFPGQAFKSTELKYRPLPQDYVEVLNDLSKLFKYKELRHKDSQYGHQMVGISVQDRSVICLQGRPRKILMAILELRILDIKINEAINQLISNRHKNPPTERLRFVSRSKSSAI